MRRSLSFAGLSVLILLALSLRGRSQPPAQPKRQVARGVVYHDANGNRLRDPGERPLPDVRVSNGKEIVKTDEQGRYALPIGSDSILFVIKPRGWRTPLSELRVPEFYYIHKPQGSPKLKYPGVDPTGPLPASIDFPLYPQKEPKQFKAILFGDPQPRDQKEIDYIAHDVVDELIGTDASFGVTLGDILFDDLSLFEASSRTVAVLGIPWYNVIGNHDINLDAREDRHSDETFERNFGPSYYSFDYGQVHFVVMDNVEWFLQDNGKGKYRGGFGKRQLEFLRNDLALVPKQQLIVLLMHIPLTDVADRQQLYRLIEKRPFCMSISGHTHHHEHRYISREDGWKGIKPHHHVINVTVSGSWWSGAPDERGIPHTTMADGAPNGHSVITFDGEKYTLDFKAAGRPADYQMRIDTAAAVRADQAEQTDVYVNVFNGSPRSKVEMRVGTAGRWQALKRTVMIDPAYQRIYDGERAIQNKTFRDLAKPKACPHLWRGKLPGGLPVGTHTIHVRTVDSHGRSYQAGRVIRVLPPKTRAEGQE